MLYTGIIKFEKFNKIFLVLVTSNKNKISTP